MSAEPRHYAKYCQNRSHRGRDIANFGFFKMAAAVILDFKIFNGQTCQEGRTTSLCQISTKSFQSRPTCGDFLLFKMAAAAIFDFLKFQFFNDRNGQEGRTVSSGQMSSKSLELWPRYGGFLFFKLAAAAILDFKNFKFLTVGRSRGSNYVAVLNFIEIGRTAVEIS